MDKQLLLKYIEGTLDSIQAETVLSWIELSEENAITFSALKAEWIFKNLPNSTISQEHASELIGQGDKRERKFSIMMRSLTRVAAVLFIPVTALALYLILKPPPPETNQVAQVLIPPPQQASLVSYHTNPGVKGLVILPDSSLVWLNSCSTIKCPGEFEAGSRYVELSGEAYFDVKENSEWPMYVKTQKGVTVVVSGTSFNISSYDNDNDFKFTLVSGSVTLLRESTNKSIEVSPEDYVIIPDDANIVTHHKNNDVYSNTAWKEGFLLFENTPMTEVIKKIERWYGVNVSIKDHAILDYYFTASFNSESISRVLDLLKITSNISYHLNENQVTLFM